MLPNDLTVREFVSRLGHPVALVGLKPIGNAKKTTVIWPAEQDDAADQACWLSRHYLSVYCNLNPLEPYMLDVVPDPWRSINDRMISKRTRVLIDVDGHDVPKDTAKVQWQAIRDRLGEPLIATDSGNGYGLIYTCDLPNDANSGLKIKSYLEQLKAEFPCVDAGVFNAGRLTRVIGTLNRSATGERIPTAIL
jgi:hypothetical protein